MPVINRFTRLLQADLHGVLDRLEEPDLLLRQSLREMEQLVADQRRALQRQSGHRERLARRLAEIDAAQEKTDGELDLCFESGEESLARGLVRRKLELDAQRSAIRQQLETIEGAHARATERHRRNLARLDDLRQKAELVLDAESDGAFETAGGAVSDEDVEVALLRERKRRAGS